MSRDRNLPSNLSEELSESTMKRCVRKVLKLSKKEEDEFFKTPDFPKPNENGKFDTESVVLYCACWNSQHRYV